jgi:hypothetical protein
MTPKTVAALEGCAVVSTRPTRAGPTLGAQVAA